MKNLTDRQKEVLEFIARFTEENGYPPTVREIGENFGISLRAVQDHIAACQKKGCCVPCRADPMCWVKAAIKSMCFLKKPHAKQRRLSPRTRSVLRCFLPAFTR